MADGIVQRDGETQSLRVNIPQLLMSRVHNYCTKCNIPIQEFVCDALSEKLVRVHKERRRRPRV